MKKNILYTILLLSVLSITMSCKTQKKEHENEHHDDEELVVLNEQQIRVLDLQLGSIEQRNLSSLIKTSGKLEVPPAATAEVTAIIGGNVKEIKVFEGDLVRRGQVLAWLEHPDYISMQETFAETANKLEYMEKEYNRQKELFENKVGAGKDFQLVKSEYNTLKAKYAGLKTRLKMLNINPENVKQGNISGTIPILSPIDGYVNEVDIKLGTYADAKDKLFTVSDNKAIHADFMIYENDIRLLKNGQKIEFTVANQPDKIITATIFAIAKEFEPNTKSVHVHAKLDKNPGNLIPGMYLSGDIKTSNQLVSALPNNAIVSEGSKSYIFVLELEKHKEETQHGTTYRRTEIIKGNQDGGYTEVKLLNPLPKNARVVLNGAYYLLSDMKKEETEHEH